MQQRDLMDIYFAILNRKNPPTSGCVRIFSPGRLRTLTSDNYKKREPHHISSVEDGTATEKEPRFSEAACQVYPTSAILKVAEAVVRTICECVLNVVKGTVPVSKPAKKKVLSHKKSLIALAEKSTPLDKKKKLLVQHGGNF